MMGVFEYIDLMNSRKNIGDTTGEVKKQSDYLAKILVIGDGGVGKTSLITRFTDQKFSNSYTATIGVDFKSKILTFDAKTVKLQIWDTAGQERFRNITQAYYRGASGILLTFSLTDHKSFQNIEKWVSQMEQNAPKECCKILVGTKLDCDAERAVNRKQADTLAVKMGISYMQTSSLTGEGVQDIFERIGRQIFQTSLKKKTKQSQQNLKIKAVNLDESKKCAC